MCVSVCVHVCACACVCILCMHANMFKQSKFQVKFRRASWATSTNVGKKIVVRNDKTGAPSMKTT